MHRRSAVGWSSDSVVGSAADAGALLAVGPTLPPCDGGLHAVGGRCRGGCAAPSRATEDGVAVTGRAGQLR